MNTYEYNQFAAKNNHHLNMNNVIHPRVVSL